MKQAILFGCLVLLAGVTSGQNVPAESVSPQINLRRTVTVDVVQRTKDAVVYISTTKLVHASPFGNDPFFRQFDFGGQNVAVQSLGSGFVIHEDGYICTNNHVIDRAREITVELPDGRKEPASLVSTDAEADLAILKIKSDKPLPYLALGDSSDLMIGEPVIAVGNPLGYSHSVSTGIVSALHRNLGDDNIKLADLIQTDAAINPGNSGGPLLNAYGQVIGINTAIRGDAQNIGFAIPIDRLRDLIPTLMNPSQVNKLDVGMKFKEARKLSPPDNIDATIEMVGGPKSVVTSIDGEHPRNIVDAYADLLKVKAGEHVAVQFAHDPTQNIAVKAMPQPDALVQAKKKLGITVEPLTPMLAQKYSLDIETGMLVDEVYKDTVASRGGLQPGDVILGMGPYRIRTLDDFGMLLQSVPKTGKVQVLIRRGNEQGYLVLNF